MEADDLQKPRFCIRTFRAGQVVISESVETEIAARTRFASAVDLCRSRDDAHHHRVELHWGTGLLETWSTANHGA